MTSWKLKILCLSWSSNKSVTGKKGCEINDGNCKIRRIKIVKRKGEREREGKEEEMRCMSQSAPTIHPKVK
jgi:hypothetical protein